MAGDWLKLEHATLDKPEVFEMASELGTAPEEVVGRLLRVWAWVDQQSLTGNALSVTEVTLDRIARRDGMAKAMRMVGWLSGSEGALCFPNFDRHNGKTAKSRALTAKRVASFKERSANAKVTQTPLPREEKRRSTSRGGATAPTSETVTQAPLVVADVPRGTSHEPLTLESGNGGAPPAPARRVRVHRMDDKDWKQPTVEEVLAAAREKGFEHIDAHEAEKFVAHHDARGWRNKSNGPVVDWPKYLRTWNLRVLEFRRTTTKQSQREADDALMARRKVLIG